MLADSAVANNVDTEAELISTMPGRDVSKKKLVAHSSFVGLMGTAPLVCLYFSKVDCQAH